MAADVENLNSAWEVISGALSPVERKTGDITRVPGAVEVLHRQGISHIAESWFFETLQQDLRKRVAPLFWAHLKEIEGSPDRIATNLCRAISELYTNLSAYLRCLETLTTIRNIRRTLGEQTSGDEGADRDLEEYTKTLFKAIIFFSTPKKFHEVFHQFYTRAFKVFHKTSEEDKGDDDDEEEEDEDEEGVHCSGCGNDVDDCSCQKILDNFHTLNRQLHELGLLERLSVEAVTDIIHQRIKHHVQNTCGGNFETSYLGTLENWLESKVLGWLRLVYTNSDASSSSDARMETNSPSQSDTQTYITAYRGRLMHFLYETYALCRIDQLFNIIIEFPESQPALQDLKNCLEKTDLRAHLVKALKTALETRLLHPGVNTADILTAYISAIRALRVLDTTGVILELVCEPVRKYLRSRDDTVRCIVSSLTDDGSHELSDELVKGQPLMLDESCHSDEENEDWESWMPDPVDADPGKTSKSRRTSDIISMLVNIYGSKELFVNEYRTLLADRILTQFNYDTEREIRYLELLKLRFGEAQLHYCEVMLKDVTDSKRINSNIMELRQKKETPPAAEEIPVNAMILSAQFWPTFREEKLELPDFLQKSLETYTKTYETLKGNRSLNWKPHLGLMDLEIELKDRKLNLSVSPVHATILMHFQEKTKWSVEELSAVMHMPSSALRRKITFWQSQGLLKEESTDHFLLVEEQKGRSQDIVIMDEDEAESAMASSHDQREEELQVFWSYIVGMLTNLESLPLERIHSMLKMFAMQGPTAMECSVGELKAFLDRKVKEQKLIYSGGVYRLPKNG